MLYVNGELCKRRIHGIGAISKAPVGTKSIFMLIVLALIPASSSADTRQYSSEAALLTSVMSLVHRSNMLYLCTSWQVYWVCYWGCLTMSGPLSHPGGWLAPWELWAEPVLSQRAESSSRTWPSQARSLQHHAGRSQPCHISHSDCRMFTRDDTRVKLKNGTSWLIVAQWEESSRAARVRGEGRDRDAMPFAGACLVSCFD